MDVTSWEGLHSLKQGVTTELVSAHNTGELLLKDISEMSTSLIRSHDQIPTSYKYVLFSP